ncbi:MAG TPA: hypothetical protein DDY31_03415 [Lachnospiraceae bacterium]|nr:hypothetical protein [Lachnospiraceae bacterium]
MKKHNGMGTVEMVILLAAPILIALIFNDDVISLLTRLAEAYLLKLGR